MKNDILPRRNLAESIYEMHLTVIKESFNNLHFTKPTTPFVIYNFYDKHATIFEANPDLNQNNI